MAIKKVTIDEDACAASAVCEAICPEVFEVKDIAEVKKGVDLNEYEVEIKEAAESCPTQAILIEEE